MSNEEIKDMETRLIDAAKVVFLNKGFVNTKMGDIAAEVGISRTAMHYYFRTKEMLFEAIFGQILGTFLPNLEKTIDSEGDFLDKLPAIIHQYNTVIRANPELPLFIISELHRDPEHLYQAVMKYPDRLSTIVHLRQIIMDNMKNGLINKMPFMDLISTFVGLFVFPVLVKKPFTDVLLDGDPDAFEAFLDRREALIEKVMKDLLTPVPTKKK